MTKHVFRWTNLSVWSQVSYNTMKLRDDVEVKALPLEHDMGRHKSMDVACPLSTGCLLTD